MEPVDIPGRSGSWQDAVVSVMGYLHSLNAAFHWHQNLSLVLSGLDLMPY